MNFPLRIGQQAIDGFLQHGSRGVSCRKQLHVSRVFRNKMRSAALRHPLNALGQPTDFSLVFSDCSVGEKEEINDDGR